MIVEELMSEAGDTRKQFRDGIDLAVSEGARARG